MNEKEYNYGIDLFKIVSMIMIITGHILGHGGILQSSLDSTSYYVIWGIEIIIVCGVNCFAMISGFVGYREKKKIHYSRYFELWIQVFFYSVGITLLMRCLGKNIGLRQCISSFLPVTFNQYWYFSAYTGVFLLMPFLNCIVEKMDKETIKKSVLLCALAFSVYASFSSRWGDPFKLNNGYSIVWLSFAYLIGAMIKKYKVNECFTSKKILFFLTGCIITSVLWRFCIGKLIGHGLENISYSYLAPTTVGISIALMLLFSKFSIKGILKKIIIFFGPTTFGVYLIHEHGMFRESFILKKFTFVTTYNLVIMLAIIIGSALTIFIIAALIEKIRIYLFQSFKIKEGCQFIEKKLEQAISKII